MTKEEAIEWLKSLNYYDGEETQEVAQAIDMAIKALEQQPCDDCISREDAMMCMTGEYVADMTYKPEDIISKHIQRLKALPPVTPTYHKSATNGEEIIRAFPNLKYTIQNGRVVTTIGVASSFDLEWWNAPYEKRGSENEKKS